MEIKTTDHEHKAYEADNCPICGTAAVIGEQPLREPRPYLIHEFTPRQTGLPVQVVNLDHPDATRRKPKGVEDKYGVICKRHKSLTTAAKRRDAHALSRKPVEWCSKCEARA